MKLLAFFRNRPEKHLDDLLIAHADALIAGTLDRDVLLAEYDQLVRSQVSDLFDLAERVHQSMQSVMPSEQFVAQLGRELALGLDDETETLLGRIRDLPPGLQLVAGIGGATLTAGLVLIASRSMPSPFGFLRNRRTATA